MRYEEYERKRPRFSMVLLLIALTLFGITVYLIFFGVSYRPSVQPSQEAIERLQQVSRGFNEVVEQTKREEHIEELKVVNTNTIEAVMRMGNELVVIKNERDELKAYVKELEDALTYATEWMDRMMEVLDGR